MRWAKKSCRLLLEDLYEILMIELRITVLVSGELKQEKYLSQLPYDIFIERLSYKISRENLISML